MIRKNYIFWGATFAGLLLDRLTKLWVVTHFELVMPPESLAVWPDVFHFTYVINTGAAFSLFQGGVWLRWVSLIECSVGGYWPKNEGVEPVGSARIWIFAQWGSGE